jgi:hypothetical protein
MLPEQPGEKDAEQFVRTEIQELHGFPLHRVNKAATVCKVAVARCHSVVKFRQILGRHREIGVEDHEDITSGDGEPGADGVTVEWKAPKTPFTSKITPVITVIEGKRKCRDTTIESEAKDRFQRGTYSFCKADTGAWEPRSPSSKTAKK